MENLIEALIETDWAKAARRYEQQLAEKTSGKKRKLIEEMDNDDQDNHHFNDMDFDLVVSGLTQNMQDLFSNVQDKTIYMLTGKRLTYRAF